MLESAVVGVRLILHDEATAGMMRFSNSLGVANKQLDALQLKMKNFSSREMASQSMASNRFLLEQERSRNRLALSETNFRNKTLLEESKLKNNLSLEEAKFNNYQVLQNSKVRAQALRDEQVQRNRVELENSRFSNRLYIEDMRNRQRAIKEQERAQIQAIREEDRIRRNYLRSEKQDYGHQMIVGGVMLGASYEMGKGLINLSKAGMEWNKVVNQMNMMGINSVEIFNMQQKAIEMSAKSYGLNRTEALRMLIDLRNVLGDTKHALAVGIPASQLLTIAGASLPNFKGSTMESELYSAIKTLEIGGKTRAPEEIVTNLTNMMRSIVLYRGRVTAASFQQFFKYSRAGGPTLSDEFIYGIAPALIQEMMTSGSGSGTGGGSGTRGGVGTMVQAMFRLGTTKVTKQIAEQWSAAGLMKNVGGYWRPIDEKMYLSNFHQWVWKYMKPVILHRLGPEPINDQKADLSWRVKLGEFVGEKTPGFSYVGQAIEQFILKEQQYRNYLDLMAAVPTDRVALQKMAIQDPMMKLQNLKAQIQNLETSISSEWVTKRFGAIDILSAGLSKLAKAFDDFKGSGTIFMDIFGGLTLRLAIGGITKLWQALNGLVMVSKLLTEESWRTAKALETEALTNRNLGMSTIGARMGTVEGEIAASSMIGAKGEATIAARAGMRGVGFAAGIMNPIIDSILIGMAAYDVNSYIRSTDFGQKFFNKIEDKLIGAILSFILGGSSDFFKNIPGYSTFINKAQSNVQTYVAQHSHTVVGNMPVIGNTVGTYLTKGLEQAGRTSFSGLNIGQTMLHHPER